MLCVAAALASLATFHLIGLINMPGLSRAPAVARSTKSNGRHPLLLSGITTNNHSSGQPSSSGVEEDGGLLLPHAICELVIRSERERESSTLVNTSRRRGRDKT
jgi:hypothetical protein